MPTGAMKNTGTFARPSLSQLIRETREALYPKGVDFWKAHGKTIGLSFSHYNQIEIGRKTPNIESAIKIAEVLKLPRQKICMMWAKEQMPTRDLAMLFESDVELHGRDIPKTSLPSLERLFIFSKVHADYLCRHPVAWQVLSLVVPNSENRIEFSKDFIQTELNLKDDEINMHLSWLEGIGAIVHKNNEYFPLKDNYYLPCAPEFQTIRESTFRAIANRISKKSHKSFPINSNVFNFSHLGIFSEQSAAKIIEFFDQVKSYAISQDECDGVVYDLVLGFAPVSEKILSTEAQQSPKEANS